MQLADLVCNLLNCLYAKLYCRDCSAASFRLFFQEYWTRHYLQLEPDPSQNHIISEVSRDLWRSLV